jgi:hypothetical protein
MNMIKRALFLLLLALMLWGFAFAAPDDHIVSSSSRTYMGGTMPPQQSESWIAADRFCLLNRRGSVIYRYDLGVRWIVFSASKKYFEEPLEAAISPEKIKDEFRIQEYGFYYEPEFEWTINSTGETQVIDGRPCQKVMVMGESDYSSETREYWVAREVPIDLARYLEKVVKPENGGEWNALYESTSILRNGLIVRSVIRRENPIAPTMVIESEVTCVETAAAPAGIYEVPQGLQKVKTRDELYAR